MRHVTLLFFFIGLTLLADPQPLTPAGSARLRMQHATDDVSRSQPEMNRASQEIPGVFGIPDHGLPLENQFSTYRCWDYASRGVVEWLANRAACRKPEYGTSSHISPLNKYLSQTEADSFDVAHQDPILRQNPTGRNAQNQGLVDWNLEKLYRPLSYKPQAQRHFGSQFDYTEDLLFTTMQGRIYQPRPGLTEEQRAQTKYGANLAHTGNSLLYRNQGGERSMSIWDTGGVSQQYVDQIKRWMVEHNSPVLFTYVPYNENNRGQISNFLGYWHTNYIVGWTTEGFVVRDSAFGDGKTSVLSSVAIVMDSAFKRARRITRRTPPSSRSTNFENGRRQRPAIV